MAIDSCQKHKWQLTGVKNINGNCQLSKTQIAINKGQKHNWQLTDVKNTTGN